MLVYKLDVLAALKAKGYTTYRIRKENLLSQSSLTKFNAGKVVSPDVLDVLCKLLDCQPGDLIEYIPDDEKASED